MKLYILLIGITFASAACGPADLSGMVTPTVVDIRKTDSALDQSTPSPPPIETIPVVLTGVVELAGTVDLTNMTPAPTPTPLRGPTTITLQDVLIRQTLILAVGDTFTLDSLIPQPIRIGDGRIVTRLPDELGTYKALATGQTELQAILNRCAGVEMPCEAPLQLLTLTIIVR